MLNSLSQLYFLIVLVAFQNCKYLFFQLKGSNLLTSTDGVGKLWYIDCA